ncbi:hypothetical protein [Psychroserpens jangbogonensis]|uniref:hypothetical protein n=1 Tax=Psychroserpens jangbogonensis TaxID=1484460 RepID=UPI00053DAD31|nr:hypothetical protein [Psychroserpens jangbogonensis]
MTTFDSIFFSVFNHYKTTHKQKANTIALVYISLLQIALVLVLGVFFSIFLEQMHVNTFSATKGWTLFVMISVFVYFRNWIVYSGRKRKVLNAKTNKNKQSIHNIWLLWFLLLGCISLAFILLNA